MALRNITNYKKDDILTKKSKYVDKIDKRISVCRAGFQYIAVTPEGDIYPCHQFVGNENFYRGNVYVGIKNNK